MTAATTHPFGEPIHVYTRAQAITRASWEDCVAWADEDNRRKGTVQDETGRLFDVVWMASRAILRAGRDAQGTVFPVYRVPRPGRARAARQVALRVVCGPGDED